MDALIVCGVIIVYGLFKSRGCEDTIVETENIIENSIPIGNNLALKHEPDAFEKIIRDLGLKSK